ncbi:MAG: hypothetical protein ACT4OO_06910 [Nitrospiraceae bacterium]
MSRRLLLGIPFEMVGFFLSLCVVGSCLNAHHAVGAPSATPPKQAPASKRLSPVEAAAQHYAEAVSKGDRVAVGRLDFACAYRMVATSGGHLKSFPAETDPVYDACWQDLTRAHAFALERVDRGVDTLWPSKGNLVFLREDVTHYPASTFVMDALGLSPPGPGLHLARHSSISLPHASFRLRPNDPVLGAPAQLVRLRVSYQDPLTSPATFAPDAYKFTNTVKRPRRALKILTVQWVVISGLRKHGFPGDIAVLNLPVARARSADAGDPQEAIPFVTEPSSAVRGSASWWDGTESPGLLIAAVGRAALFPDLIDRVALLNRVLIIDPNQPDALTVLSRGLFETVVKEGTKARRFDIKDRALSDQVDELYWNTYAQTTRMDLSLGMEMGGLANPTTADFLYRMIPAMEALALVRPGDIENRVHLGMAYRWNNDQLAAIRTHEALLKDVPPERVSLRARVLIELAWSRIAKVSWNRIFDDPEIQQAYQEAGEALKLAEQPLDKFTAAYTMAYSLLFTPKRDNKAILEHLTEARRWYGEVTGGSQQAWQYLLGQELLKAVLDADPAFQPLFAAS